MKLSRRKKATLVIVLAGALLLADQVSKILVKTHMHIGESKPVCGNWFQILFVENPGMAFGLQFGGDFGKYFLTTLRIALFAFLLYYIIHLLKKKDAPIGVLLGLTAIMVGALGNIIDCLFYGLIFEPSTYTHVANFTPFGKGYGKFFLGKVVDMLYFPIINTTYPSWFPFKAGEEFIFFRPIFNIADSCITVGALYLLIFKWKYFMHKEETKKDEPKQLAGKTGRNK